jgi:hypothetical protein
MESLFQKGVVEFVDAGRANQISISRKAMELNCSFLWRRDYFGPAGIEIRFIHEQLVHAPTINLWPAAAQSV